MGSPYGWSDMMTDDVDMTRAPMDDFEDDVPSAEAPKPDLPPAAPEGSAMPAEGNSTPGLTSPDSPFVLGIDLGTCNSAVAVVQRNEPIIIRVDGEKTCPSVMTIIDGAPVIGKRARSRVMIEPDNVEASIKRRLGDEDYVKVFPGLPDKEYRPRDIAGEILAKLVMAAQQSDEVQLNGNPKKVVICIPANFNERQRQETLEAARLAQLEVIKLLEEPSAAAICYADGRDRDQTIMVYDLGGGTFDVSILKVVSRSNGRSRYHILAKAGVAQLGGDDFDYELMKVMAERFAEKSGINLLDLEKDQGVSKSTLRAAQQKLKDVCETSKVELSTALTRRVEIPSLIKDESGTVHSLEEEITREDFEELIRPKIMESRTAMERALRDAEISVDDISRIILIGGSTRVPLVRKMVTEMFGKEPYKDEDPDTAVARGAAIYGARLLLPVVDGEEGIVIDDIVTLNLGIEVGQGGFSTIISKNTPIDNGGATFTKEYGCPQDNMTELAIRVYQSSEDAEWTGEDSVAFVDEFFLKGIPPRPKGHERIKVTFTIDSQNTLKVKAESSSTSEELTVERGA